MSVSHQLNKLLFFCVAEPAIGLLDLLCLSSLSLSASSIYLSDNLLDLWAESRLRSFTEVR